MTQAAIDYATSLRKTETPKELLQQVKDVLEAVPQVRSEFEDPTVSIEKKHLIIDRVFPKEIRDFLKILCDNMDFGLFDEICTAYDELGRKPEAKENQAQLIYVTAPTDEQLEGIKAFLAKEFHNPDMELTLKEDKSIKSGFVLRVGTREFDWSEKGRIEQLENRIAKAVNSSRNTTFSEESIVSILKSSIDDFELEAKDKEIGVVNWVGDGIANVDGIDHAFYGEIVVFDCGVKGMVQDVRRDEIGVILFGRDTDIKEGTRVIRTGKMAGIPVGEAFEGRIIDALGAPLDGQGDIESVGFRPIEFPAPSIVDRKSVTVPMETGILSIDSMFPIGRGQRELIIGDRQTGKTAIAVDTIINQRANYEAGDPVYCIYVAIGQKGSTVATIVNTLRENGAMDYTIVVAATAGDPAALQYYAPFAGAAIGEYFRDTGRHALVVYDDLSKQAVAYREVSLILRRPSGREAYPGDIFYLHSRLLERAARIINQEEVAREMNDLPESLKGKVKGGGSLTALPIIETQAGDVSAYIPTNVISITDGQIFLDTDLFNQGNRPAINVGISVSRVGGNAQIKAMKKVAGTLKIDQAQYRELEAFSKFSSDMDPITALTIDKGRKNAQLLIQPQYSPMPVEQQIAILYCGTHGLLRDVPLNNVQDFERSFIESLQLNHQEDVLDVLRTGVIDDNVTKAIEETAAMVAKQYL